MPKPNAFWLLSIMGISNTVMKLIYGAIMVIFPRISATRFVAVSLFVTSMALITTGFRPQDPFVVQGIWCFFLAQGFGEYWLRSLIG
jgi:hypothetical protein